MALPLANVAKYELVLPSQQKTIQYRPFLVKEEKVLLMAMESGESKEMITAIKEIVKSCTFGEMIAEDYPMFDIEYVFLQIRSKSVGEVAKLKVLCPDDGKTYAEAEVDLTKVEVQVDDNHTNKIIIDENRNLGIVLKYPTLKNYDLMSSKSVNTNDMDKVFNILIDSIDHVFEGDKVYPAKDSTKEELKDFIETLPQESFMKIKTFFDTMPKLKHEIEVTNPKTQVVNKVTLQGVSDFFELASPTQP
jgi:hypothetical protein